MRRRIIRVNGSPGRLGGRPLGTLSIDPDRQRVEWRPYRCRTVESLSLGDLVRLLEWKFEGAGRRRAACERRRSGRK